MRLNSFQWLSLLTSGSVYTLIVLGGIVSSTGSGLACPDWPLCHGQVIPSFTPAVVIEYTHRVWTIVVTLLVIATTALALKKYGLKNRVARFATLTFILLLGQIVLGMVTVDTRTLPAVVTSHLALATLVFGGTLTTSIVSLTSSSKGV